MWWMLGNWNTCTLISHQLSHKMFLWLCGYFCGKRDLKRELINSKYKSVKPEKEQILIWIFLIRYALYILVKVSLRKIWCHTMLFNPDQNMCLSQESSKYIVIKFWPFMKTRLKLFHPILVGSRESNPGTLVLATSALTTDLWQPTTSKTFTLSLYMLSSTTCCSLVLNRIPIMCR